MASPFRKSTLILLLAMIGAPALAHPRNVCHFANLPGRLAAVRREDYYQSYRLVAGYLAYLDSSLPASK